MKGIDVLTERLAKMAGWRWLLSAFAACVLPIVGIYAVAARYQVTDPAPDRSFAYTASEAYAMLVRLGEPGRHGLMLIHALDYPYMVAYALFYGIAIAGLASRLRPGSVWLRRLALLPILAALADLFENVCLDVATLAFPRRLDLLLGLAGGFTTFKATTFTVFQISVVLGLAALAAKSVAKRWRRPVRATGQPASD